METIVSGLIGALVGIIIGIIILAILGYILQLLWNSTLPDVFGFKTIATWQAMKIIFISSLLFGGHRVIEPGLPSSITPTKAETGAK